MYREKYFKYKHKYLELKNKLRDKEGGVLKLPPFKSILRRIECDNPIEEIKLNDAILFFNDIDKEIQFRKCTHDFGSRMDFFKKITDNFPNCWTNKEPSSVSSSYSIAEKINKIYKSDQENKYNSPYAPVFSMISKNIISITWNMQQYDEKKDKQINVLNNIINVFSDIMRECESKRSVEMLVILNLQNVELDFLKLWSLSNNNFLISGLQNLDQYDWGLCFNNLYHPLCHYLTDTDSGQFKEWYPDIGYAIIPLRFIVGNMKQRYDEKSLRYDNGSYAINIEEDNYLNKVEGSEDKVVVCLLRDTKISRSWVEFSPNELRLDINCISALIDLQREYKNCYSLTNSRMAEKFIVDNLYLFNEYDYHNLFEFICKDWKFTNYFDEGFGEIPTDFDSWEKFPTIGKDEKDEYSVWNELKLHHTEFSDAKIIFNKVKEINDLITGSHISILNDSSQDLQHIINGYFNCTYNDIAKSTGSKNNFLLVNKTGLNYFLKEYGLIRNRYNILDNILNISTNLCLHIVKNSDDLTVHPFHDHQIINTVFKNYKKQTDDRINCVTGDSILDSKMNQIWGCYYEVFPIRHAKYGNPGITELIAITDEDLEKMIEFEQEDEYDEFITEHLTDGIYGDDDEYEQDDDDDDESEQDDDDDESEQDDDDDDESEQDDDDESEQDDDDESEQDDDDDDDKYITLLPSWRLPTPKNDDNSGQVLWKSSLSIKSPPSHSN